MHTFRKFLKKKILNLEITTSCQYLFLMGYFSACQLWGQPNAVISVKVNDLITSFPNSFVFPELINLLYTFRYS